ncbi:putative RNA-dependent RNA polymerase SHL2 [Zea mays]|uniref:RNA-dependent RNA polymerase n=1 Tax=Zea mays TaxID=4577 RepID=A0A3L6DGQ6_MAIZE|nr:putative RNA-dependent RNA polymerase SHL2 [Zea mays]
MASLLLTLRAFLGAAATGLLTASRSVAPVGWLAPVLFAHSDIACRASFAAAAVEEGSTPSLDIDLHHILYKYRQAVFSLQKRGIRGDTRVAMARSRTRSPESTRRLAHRHRAIKPSKSNQQHPHHERRRTAGLRPPGHNFAEWPTGPATRAILTGFDAGLSARGLADELERVAGTVWRCRIKTSVTPPESYPDFQLSDQDEPPRDGRVAPHAFVHFEHRNAADRAGDFFTTRILAQSRHMLHGHAARRRDGVTDAAKPMLFPDSCIEIGDVVAPDTFLVAWRGTDDSASALDFVVDPSGGSCRLLFARYTAFTCPDKRRPAALLCCDVKLEFALAHVAEALAFQADDSLVLRLSAAPLVYYRTSGDDVHGRVPFQLVDADDDPWIRTTDVTRSGAIGRCLAYRVSFAVQFWPTMRVALECMQRQGVPVHVRDRRCRGFTVLEEAGLVQPMRDAFFSPRHDDDAGAGLRFPVLYLVNVLMHNGVVNPHQMTPEFFGLLMRTREDVNVAALTELFGAKLGVCDNPCWRLKNAQDRAAKNLDLVCRSRRRKASDCDAEVRRLIVTPTREYCMPPQVERSNRVIRHYHELSDRFLRVTFTDEGMLPLNPNALTLRAVPSTSTPSTSRQMTSVYRRVQTALTEGLIMCGRRYSFLAFSASQLKQKSAWFFAEDGATTVAGIKEWMGQFPIRNPAKHAARMGLCFTSSYATVTMQPGEVDEDLEDVTRNGYNFSDGIGVITEDLALEVAEMLPLADRFAPSAYQIRYAGFKGVVAVWPPGPGQEDRGTRAEDVASAQHEEVPVHAHRAGSGVLDQVPASVLEPPDHNAAHHPRRSRRRLLAAAGSDARQAQAGFVGQRCGGLLNKTWIFVPKGRWLMGCLDEFGILEQGQCFLRVSTPSVGSRCVNRSPIFPSEYKGDADAQVITGTVVMAKNPCLHPGDVRILEAVDVPDLYHLVDCFVFPKKGERPHADEASGSDLDGDVYFVTWDESLVPPGRKSCTPMDYSPAKTKQLPRDVHQQDTVDFYLESMVYDNLGRICNAHAAHADRSDDGAMDPKCIELARLASIAVDSAKTGEIVRMPPALSPKEYPDFMGKEDAISYRSEKILGRLYRSVLGENDGDFLSRDACISDEIRYDADLEVLGASDFLQDAWRCSKKYHHQLKERINYAYSNLHQEFRSIFESIDASTDNKNLAYEMKASAWYQVTYHPEIIRSREPGDEDAPTRLSFAWIAVDYLAQIKMKRHVD